MTFLGLKFELFVADIERSTRFYRDLLEFEPADEPAPDYVTLANGPVTLSLARFADLPPHHHFLRDGTALPGIGVEICLYGSEPEVARLHAGAAAAGAGLEPLKQRPWGTRDFRLIDPDGYYIRVSTVAP